MILLVFRFMFQFHVADILGKELQREGWRLKCFLPAEACFNHDSEPTPNILNMMA